MATSGSFDLNLDKISNMTNNTVAIGATVTEEVGNQGDLIGLAIAITISLTLIFGVVFLVWNFIARFISKAKGLK